MDQCHRQSPVRLPGLGGGQWLYLGGEQSRKSTDALVQRSGRRSLRRSVLPPRRGQPGAVERHCAADSRRWALQRTPRIRLQPFRPSLPGHRHGSGAIRRAGGPDQDFPTGAAQPLRQVTTAVVHQLCGTGTRQRRATSAAFIETCQDVESGALLARNPGTPPFPGVSCSPTCVAAKAAGAVIVANSSGRSVTPRRLRRCSARRDFPDARGPGSTRAWRSSVRSSWHRGGGGNRRIIRPSGLPGSCP